MGGGDLDQSQNRPRHKTSYYLNADKYFSFPPPTLIQRYTIHWGVNFNVD